MLKLLAKSLDSCLAARIWIGRKIIIVEQIKRSLSLQRPTPKVQRKEQAAGRRHGQRRGERGWKMPLQTNCPSYSARRSSQRSWHLLSTSASDDPNSTESKNRQQFSVEFSLGISPFFNYTPFP